MTAFVLSANTNIDALASKAGGDTYDTNGFKLTVDQDSRVGLNQSTSATLGTYQVNVNYTVPVQAQGISTSGSTGPSAAEIAAAVVAALQATTIPVNNTLINGAPVIGDGSEANPWRGVGVQP